jgi:hypothetical protein
VKLIHGQRFSENRVLGRILGPKWEEASGSWRKMHKERFVIYTPYQNYWNSKKKKLMTWSGMYRTWETRKLHVKVWSEYCQN